MVISEIKRLQIVVISEIKKAPDCGSKAPDCGGLRDKNAPDSGDLRDKEGSR